MTAIDQRMGYAVEDERSYLDYVSNVILGREPSGEQVDPFDLQHPFGVGAYVLRPEVERNVNLARNLVILGPRGYGKSTLFGEVLTRPHKRALIVGLRLVNENREPPAELFPLKEAEARIFSAYWTAIISEHHRRARYFPAFSQDLAWMTRLRRFYVRNPVYEQLEPRDFWLEDWLRPRPEDNEFVNRSPSREVLGDLVRWITSGSRPADEGHGGSAHSAFDRVELVIDGVEAHTPAMAKFFHTAGRLAELDPPKLKIKLLADSGLEDRLSELVKDRPVGQVRPYKLPGWQTTELKAILRQRLQCHVQGGAGDWGLEERIPPDALEPPARAHLVDEIVNGALRAYERGDRFDAPIHLLILARGVVARCARQSQRESALPIAHEHIKQFITDYWDLK